MYIIDNKTLNLPHKSANYWRYECGQMPKNANVICDGSLSNQKNRYREFESPKKKVKYWTEKVA